MKYKYSIQSGVTSIKTNTKKYILSVIVGLGLVGAMTVPTLAAKPANQGCFGTDRAAYAKENGSLGINTGGVGYYASQRAGDNGAINQAYKTSCGGDPVQ